MGELSSEEKLRSALLETFFANHPEGFPRNPGEQRDLDQHLHERFDESNNFVLPWVARKVDLAGARVLEVGCGTGSSTASFAPHCANIYGYDITHQSVEAANERLRIMNVSNARCHAAPPDLLLQKIEEDHPNGVDVVLLYAVLEHQNIEERLATIELCWRLLRPDGHLVVTDSPNRLCYKHFHTSEVPFFDMVPEPLKWSLIASSPRLGFRETMTELLKSSPGKLSETLTRWGTGISFHEFEAVIGPLEKLVVADGFDTPLDKHKRFLIEEELLLHYLVVSDLNVPIGFCRASVDIIFRKPGRLISEPFQSNGEIYTRRLQRKISEEHETPPNEPPRMDLSVVEKLANESLNGKTLGKLALRKLLFKLTRRPNP